MYHKITCTAMKSTMITFRHNYPVNRSTGLILSFILFVLSAQNSFAQENSFKYDYVGDFHDGMAMVMNHGLCGFIDRSGYDTITKQFSYAWDFQDGMARVAMTADGHPITFRSENHGWSRKTYDYQIYYYPIDENCKYGFIDKKGNIVVPIVYDGAYDFREGYSIVWKDGKYGLIDLNGLTVIPLVYDDLRYDSNSSFIVVGKDGKYGYLDFTGETVIPLEYDGCGYFSEGLAIVKKGDKCGFIDKSGDVVIPFDYDGNNNMYGKFVSGHFLILENKQMHVIDRKGTIVFSIGSYKLVTSDFLSDGLAITRADNTLEIIDTNWHKQKTYNCNMLLFDYSKTDSSYIIQTVGKGNKKRKRINGNKIMVPVTRYGVMDINGHYLTTKKYDAIGRLSENRATARINNKMGFMNEKAEIIIPIRYWDVGSFSEGLAMVAKKGKCGFIDTTGSTVIPLEYDNARSFNEGLAAVKKNGKWGFIDKSGNMLVLSAKETVQQ